MRNLLISLLFLPALMAAENFDVTKLHVAGPYPTVKPFMTDTLDAEGKKIDLDELYMESISPTLPKKEGDYSSIVPVTLSSGEGQGEGLFLASFTILALSIRSF